jgi:hypothetical protein
MTATRSSALIAASLAALLDNGCANGVEPAPSSDLDSSLPGVLGSGGIPSGSTGGSGGSTVQPGTGGSQAGGGAGGISNGGGPGTGGGGAGGASGTGGTANGTGGGPSIPPAIGDLKVQYRTSSPPKDQELKPVFNVINSGTKVIPLADLTIRYFYTVDGTPSGTDYQSLVIDYAAANMGGTTVKLSFAPYTPPQTGADTYIEVGFSGTNTLGAGQSTGDIQTRINWKNYTQSYDETNDYSYDGTKTTFVDWPKATLYQRGVLIWGREPDGTVPKVGDAGAAGARDAAAD